MHSHHFSFGRIFTLFTAATGTLLLLLTSAIGNDFFTAQNLRGLARAQSVRHIPTCAEAGVCRKGEQGFILRIPDAQGISIARRKGCKVKRLLKENAVLRCPSAVSIPNASVERALRVVDLYSNGQIHATEVQATGITGNNVRVAILDTGIDNDHPELAGKVALIQNFTSDDLQDLAGHGTHVAGTIAGQGFKEFDDRGGTNRALGVAPGVEFVIAKVCNNEGWCLEGDILSGIEWAVAQKAKVINLSLGGGSFLNHCDDDTLARQVNWAVQQGVTVIAAAGNHGETDEGISTPACASKAIAVGAVDATDTRPVWSSYGSAIDVTAPGVSILSSVSCLAAGTCPTPAYGWWSGTSMATPHVSGLAALLLERDPTLIPAHLTKLITETADDLGESGFDPFHGYGRINATSALAALQGQSSSSSISSLQQSSSSSHSQDNFSSEATSAPTSSSLSSSSVSSSSESMSSREADTSSARSEPHEEVPERSPPFKERIPRILPKLPPTAAPAARQHRPTTPRGSPRW